MAAREVIEDFNVEAAAKTRSRRFVVHFSLFVVFATATLVAWSVWYGTSWWLAAATTQAGTMSLTALWIATGSRRWVLVPLTALAGFVMLSGVGRDFAFAVSESCLSNQAEEILNDGRPSDSVGCRLVRLETAEVRDGTVIFVGTVPPWLELGLSGVGLVYVPEGGTPPCAVELDYGSCVPLTERTSKWYEYETRVDWNS